MSGPQELIAGFLEGWKVDDPKDCARLLIEALSFMGFEVGQRTDGGYVGA